jgi:hypothetical protein
LANCRSAGPASAPEVMSFLNRSVVPT